MTFQIHALPLAPFAPLFDLDDSALKAKGARRVTATATPGFPCRVSLEDAEVGEELILLNHRHLPGNSPYTASHAIYVRKDAQVATPLPGEVPEVLANRLLSLRAFDEDDMMQSADVVEGDRLAARLDHLFADPQIREVHIHNAAPGCFAARATRAGQVS